MLDEINEKRYMGFINVHSNRPGLNSLKRRIEQLETELYEGTDSADSQLKSASLK